MFTSRTKNLIVWVVAGGWVGNLVAPSIWDSYKPVDAVNGIFLLVVGTVLAREGKESRDESVKQEGGS